MYDAKITITRNTKTKSGTTTKVANSNNTIVTEVMKGTSLANITSRITTLLGNYTGTCSIIIKESTSE